MSNFIISEMLIHPALFSHLKAQKIAILDSESSDLLAEAVKHSNIKEIHIIQKNPPADLHNTDTRVVIHKSDSKEWLAKQSPKSFDILIIASDRSINNPAHFQACFDALNTDGILMQLCASPYELASLLTTHQYLEQAGFADMQILNFPGHNMTSGWRSAMMGIKHGRFKRPSERTIFNKNFSTQYYNFDIHRAALVLPEFVREKISI